MPRGQRLRGFWKLFLSPFHMLGADVGDTIRSPRVKGASTVPLVIPKKKIPLTVAQVGGGFLEHLAMEGSAQESVFAGYLCMGLFCI